MSKVSGYLFTLIRKQVENRGIIVCYDPQKKLFKCFLFIVAPRTGHLVIFPMPPPSFPSYFPRAL
jgi:hypothetical protein